VVWVDVALLDKSWREGNHQLRCPAHDLWRQQLLPPEPLRSGKGSTEGVDDGLTENGRAGGSGYPSAALEQGVIVGRIASLETRLLGFCHHPALHLASSIRSFTPVGSSTSIMPAIDWSASGAMPERPIQRVAPVAQPTELPSPAQTPSTGGAKLSPPRVKLAAADALHPAGKRGRRSRRHALRQNPQLLFQAPAAPPLRTGENLATNLPSPLSISPTSPIARRPNKAAESHSARPRQDTAPLTLTVPLPPPHGHFCQRVVNRAAFLDEPAFTQGIVERTVGSGGTRGVAGHGEPIAIHRSYRFVGKTHGRFAKCGEEGTLAACTASSSMTL